MLQAAILQLQTLFKIGDKNKKKASSCNPHTSRKLNSFTYF